MAQTARNLEIYSPIRYGAAFAERKTAAKRFSFGNFLTIILFFFSLTFVYVYQQALVAQESIAISTLKSEIRQQQTANQKMKVETEILRSPARIELLADEMGMIKDDAVDYLVIEKEEARNVSDRGNNKGLIASMYSFLQR